MSNPIPRRLTSVVELIMPWLPAILAFWVFKSLPVEIVRTWPPFYTFLPMVFFFVSVLLFMQTLQMRALEKRLNLLENGARPAE